MESTALLLYPTNQSANAMTDGVCKTNIAFSTPIP